MPSDSHRRPTLRETVGLAAPRRVSLAAMVVAAFIGTARGESPLISYLDALRQRELTELSESYCRRGLADSTLDAASRAIIAGEFASMLTRRALRETDEKKRSAIFDEARSVLERAASVANQDDRFVLEYQACLLDYARAKWLLEWTELRSVAPSYPPEVAERFGQAIVGFERVLAAATHRQSELRRKSSTVAERLQAEELEPFVAMVQRKIGSAQLLSTRTLLAESPQRTAALKLIVERLTPFAKSVTAESAAFDSAVDLINAHKQLGDFTAAGQRLDQLDELRRDLSEAQTERLFFERLSWLADQGKTLDALERWREAAEGRDKLPASWDYLYLRLLLEQSGSRRLDFEQATKLQASAFRQLRKLRERENGFWTRRAELLMERYSSQLTGGASTDLERAAELLARSEKFDEAADVYLQAAAQADRSKQTSQAAALTLQAGRLYEKNGNAPLAFEQFETILKKWPTESSAPTASLQAIVVQRRLYLAKPTTAAMQQQDRRIEAHLARFPRDPTIGEALFILANLIETEAPARAIDAYAKIPREHRLRGAALVEIGRTYDRWLKPFDDRSNRPAADLSRAAEQLRQLLDDNEPLSADQRTELEVRVARLLLDPRLLRVDEASGRLLRHLKSTSRRQPAVLRYLIFAHIWQDEFAQAEQEASELAAASADELLAALDLLEQSMDDLSELKQKFAGKIERTVADALEQKRGQIPTDRLEHWLLLSALLRLRSDDHAEVAVAADVVRKLEKSSPDNPRIAAALASLELRERPAEAVRSWSEIMRRCPPGSISWYRAKLFLLIAARRAGDMETARKQLAVLEVLHPQLGGPALKPRFLAEKSRLGK